MSACEVALPSSGAGIFVIVHCVFEGIGEKNKANNGNKVNNHESED